MYVWQKSVSVTIVPLHKESGEKRSILKIWGKKGDIFVFPE